MRKLTVLTLIISILLISVSFFYYNKFPNLVEATKRSDFDRVKMLLNNKHSKEELADAILAATYRKDLDITKLLLKNGLPVEIRSRFLVDYPSSIQPLRGEIYDTNGVLLAENVQAYNICIDPLLIKDSNNYISEINNSEFVSLGLSKLLNIDTHSIMKKLEENNNYEIIQKNTNKDDMILIKQWKEQYGVTGIIIEKTIKRNYPFARLASNVIGFVGDDNQGLGGIEFGMEKELKEKNVFLTLDKTIQNITEDSLDSTISRNKDINEAVAIVMNPNSGEIYAIVSKPDFDLNNPYAAPINSNPETWNGRSLESVEQLQKKVWRNKAISDTYEPGGVFSTITAAAGLEQGVISEESIVSDNPFILKEAFVHIYRTDGTVDTCNSQSFKEDINLGYIPHYTRLEYEDLEIFCRIEGGHGSEPFNAALINGCDPVFAKLSENIDLTNYYNFVNNFGFNKKTDIELAGEGMSIIRDNPCNTDMAYNSFGQEFTVTPIQMITAYSAIANGGNIIKPMLVKKIVRYDGEICEEFVPKIISNPISKQTSDRLKIMLEGVVNQGVVKKAFNDGYRIAGTAGISETNNKERTIDSFCGFAPANKPEICVLVNFYRQGTKTSYNEEQISAQVAGKILKDVIDYNKNPK